MNLTVDLNYDVVVAAEERFNFLPAQVVPDEEWDAIQISAKIIMKFDIQGIPDFQNAADIPEITLDFTIIEKGKTLGTETVETAAGTFEDCLKIEYKTKTEMIATQTHGLEDLPGESVTTLWLAPNVGIVKFHQQADKIFLNIMSERGVVDTTMSDKEAVEITAPAIKTFELTNYEVVPDPSQGDGND